MTDVQEKYLKALIEAIGRTKEEVAERVLRSAFGEVVAWGDPQEHELEVTFED